MKQLSVSESMTMFDSRVCLSELHASTLKGTFLTYIARGEAKVPLGTAVKTARTYVGKRYISQSALRAIVDEVKAVGVEGFRTWADYDERQRRFGALAEALSAALAESSP